MLQAQLSNPIVTEKLGSVSSSQANQTGWTFRRVLGYYGTRKEDSNVRFSYWARTNRTQSFVLVFNPIPVNAKGFWL